MKRTHERLAAFAAGALVFLATATEATAQSAPRDEVYCAKAVETQRLETLAFLPVVAVCDNALAEAAVEKGWLDLCSETKVRWLKPGEVEARLRSAAGRNHDLATDVEAEIWRLGTVTRETAVRVARALEVDGVLSIRVERWEIVDGGRGTVGLTATLTGASGAKLWSITGLAGHGLGRTSSERNWTPEMTLVWDPRLEPRPEQQRLGVALYSLLARWSPELPTPLFREGAAAPMLAGRK